MASHHISKALFVNQGKVCEVPARKAGHGRLSVPRVPDPGRGS